MAIKAFAQGERWDGHVNRTTYPARWYGELERNLGDEDGELDSYYLSSFNDVYNRKLAELGGDVESYWGLRHTVTISEGMDIEIEVSGKKRSAAVVGIAVCDTSYKYLDDMINIGFDMTEVQVMELMEVLRISLVTLRNRIDRP